MVVFIIPLVLNKEAVESQCSFSLSILLFASAVYTVCMCICVLKVLSVHMSSFVSFSASVYRSWVWLRGC